ncbi:uncharacterized protein LOC110858448 isoform X2 [Folsomia candida]|uniref:uncharacterized protein LOC110858448 isoform X2 n=1 Tax=Folsomia candida TaxID=158441 RepID=UPI0016051B27|nr:uncharacterized protein LOC110858448 isoform X2 [Folsomia candida]
MTLSSSVVCASSWLVPPGFTTDCVCVSKRRRNRRKRSVRQSSGNGAVVEECRTNAVCGWQIYNASTRVHQRYVPTTCRCNKKDLCTRAEDDIGVPAYVYRCRDYTSRRNRTTVRPAATNDITAGGQSS